MRPVQMLDHKADLCARLTDPQVRNIWRNQLVLDMGDALPKDVAQGSAAAIIARLWQEAPELTAYHVSEEMTKLTVFAASQLDEMDRLTRTIVPSRSGIARFEGGMPFTDVRDKKMRVSWLMWIPIMSQTYKRFPAGADEPDETTLIFLFNDHIEEPDDIYYELLEHFSKQENGPDSINRVLGRWGFQGCENIYEGQRLGPAMVIPDDGKTAEVLADGDAPVAYTNPLRLAHAFWLLLGQTVSASYDAEVDRLSRRRANRAQIPPRVVVVGLRNLASTGRAEGESLVEWSHRWAVRGHWRWQVCGPHHPLAQEIEPGVWRARMWIAPFIKGPKDKPLVISEKVYAVHR